MMTTNAGFYALKQALADLGFVGIFWHTDDVLGDRPDLTAEQAMEVLLQFTKWYDGMGESFGTLRQTANELFPTKDASEA